MTAHHSSWHLPVLIFHATNKNSRELKKIGFDKARKILKAPKGSFLDIKIVYRLWTPFGYLIIFEVPGNKWRKWMTEKELKGKLA